MIFLGGEETEKKGGGVLKYSLFLCGITAKVEDPKCKIKENIMGYNDVESSTFIRLFVQKSRDEKSKEWNILVFKL